MTLKIQKILNRDRPIKITAVDDAHYIDESLYRTVLLRDEQSNKILSLGSIKINLDVLEKYPELIASIKEAKLPFGRLLEDYKVNVKGKPGPYYKISNSEAKNSLFSFLKDDARQAFKLDSGEPIYGRQNILSLSESGKELARVYEFLAV
jgi:hypothetical protein